MRRAVPDASLVGHEVGGYRIVSVIGRGAVGVVYLAEHVRLQRKVALKVLTAELARRPAFRERFLRESRIAAGLDHPNVVPVHDAGEADGVLFLAMRYVAGSDLRALLRRTGPLEPRRALAIVGQVARALDAAHARGLVHRDVKPGNVLIAENEHAYLADFGVSQELDGAALPGARAGSLEGTLGYLAPEQIEGGSVDGRADVYGLACVLYQCLAGAVPYENDSDLEKVWSHVHQPPPNLMDARPDLPPELARVLGAAMAKDPGDRPATSGQFARAAVAAVYR